jgi:hypothetical protein
MYPKAMLIATLSCLLASACPPVPPPNPPPQPPDASDAAPAPPPAFDSGSACDAACSVLVGLHCWKGADCAATLARDLGSGKIPDPTTHKPMTCAQLAQLTTVVDAQRLGFVCSP